MKLLIIKGENNPIEFALNNAYQLAFEDYLKYSNANQGEQRIEEVA